jgi:hypothetical protein
LAADPAATSLRDFGERTLEKLVQAESS